MNILAEGGGMLLVRAFTIGSGFLIVTLLTRLLGPEAYGIYALCISIVMVLGLFMHLGLPTLLTREIAASLARGEPHVAGELERFSLKLILIMAASVGFVVILSFRYGVTGTFLALAAPFALLIVANAATYALQQRSMAILSGRRKQLLSQLPDGVVRPFVMLVLLPVVLMMFPHNIALAIGTYVVANLVSLLVGTILVARGRPLRLDRSLEGQSAGHWLHQLPPFTMIGLVGIIQANADTIVLASILPIKEVSIYKVAAFIGSMPGNLHAVVIGLLLPRAASAWARGERDHLAQLAINASRSAFAFAFLYAVVTWLFGKTLIFMAFGSAYADVYPVACLLVVPPLLTTAVGSSFAILNMCHQASLSSRLSAIAVLLTIGGLAAGGSMLGMMGGAMAVIGVTAFLSMSSWIAVKRRIGIRCDIFAMGQDAALDSLTPTAPESHTECFRP